MSAFDEDPGVRPAYRQFVAYAAEWEPIPDDGLPRYPEGLPPQTANLERHEPPAPCHRCVPRRACPPSSSRWSPSALSTPATTTTTNARWNLFLAWIPFGLAIYVYEGYRRGTGRVQLWAAGRLWLVFFPNAPYIVTDFKWLRDWTGAPIWYDVVLVSSAAWCGLLLGFMSLYLMQAVVRRALGAVRPGSSCSACSR